MTAGNIGLSDYCDNAIGVDCSGYACNVYDIGRTDSAGFVNNVGYPRYANTIADLASAAHKMDFWAYNNGQAGHVMMHATYDSTNGIIYVYDATKTVTGGRTSYRSVQITDLNSYVLKNPWHSGNCSANGYKNNSTNHYHQCVTCGYTYDIGNHTWSSGFDYNSSEHWHYCTVCGRENAHSSHTYGITYSYNNYQHWVSCTSCGRQKRSNHTWITFGTKYKCSVCGCISNTNPGVSKYAPIFDDKRVFD